MSYAAPWKYNVPCPSQLFEINDVQRKPRENSVWQKSAKVYHCLYSSLEQLQIALWTYMFLKLGLNNEKYIHNRPPKFNKNYRTRAARVKGFPEIKCFPSGSNLSRPRAFFLSTGPQRLWYMRSPATRPAHRSFANPSGDILVSKLCTGATIRPNFFPFILFYMVFWSFLFLILLSFLISSYSSLLSLLVLFFVSLFFSSYSIF